jgi:hypothetical protein
MGALPSAADSAAFVALRRPRNGADHAFANEAAPYLQQLISEQGLNLDGAREVITSPAGRAALIPGNGSLCYVSVSPALGTVTMCLPHGWPATHHGFGFMGNDRAQVVVGGVVPDSIGKLTFTDAAGAVTEATLNTDNAYLMALPARPVTMTLHSTDGQTEQQQLSRPFPGRSNARQGESL